METPNSKNWEYNAPQFVDFGDPSTFENNEENDEYFKENEEFFSPKSNFSKSFATPAAPEIAYEFRNTPLREIKNHGGTPYREGRPSKLFNKRGKIRQEIPTLNEGEVHTPSKRETFDVASVQEAKQQGDLICQQEEQDDCNKRDTFNVSSVQEAQEQTGNFDATLCRDSDMADEEHDTSNKRDTFNVSSIQEALSNIEAANLDASHDVKNEDAQIDDEKPVDLEHFHEPNPETLIEDAKNMSVSKNVSRRSSYLVHSPVVHRVTFSDDTNVTPINNTESKKQIMGRKATPAPRTSAVDPNSNTVTKRKSINPQKENVPVESEQPVSKVSFASDAVDAKKNPRPSEKPKPTRRPSLKKRGIENKQADAKKTIRFMEKPKSAQPQMLKKRVSLYQARSNASIANKSANASMANKTLGNQTHKPKRAFAAPATESAYNFMNSMRNYSPFVAPKSIKKPTTIGVAPKFATDSRVGPRKLNSDVPKPAPPTIQRNHIRKVPIKPTVRTVPKPAPVKPFQAKPAPISTNRSYCPAPPKKPPTKAVTPNFASDQRIQIWHRKHPDEVDAQNTGTFKARPAPNFKKLHEQNKQFHATKAHKPTNV